MQGVVVREFGPVESHKYEEFQAPEAGPEAYRVMIRSSVTPAYTESRWNLPCLVPRR